MVNTGAIEAQLAAAPFAQLALSTAPASILVMATGVVLLAGGLALLTGTRTRLASVTLMLVLIPITVTVHLTPDLLGPLFKNVAIFGGLLHFAVNGTHAYAIDRWLARPATAIADPGIA